jgi:Cof subfamily protein (haloacid dehalogenase superfamily)
VKPPIRLLAIDIDGTLLNSKFELPAPNAAALRRAHERGVEIVLVTGRRHGFALPIAQQCGVPLCLISSNGAVTKSLTGELFHRELLPVGTARRICEHMREYREAMVITFDRDEERPLVLERATAFSGSILGWMQKNAEHIREVAPIERCLTCDPLQAMFCGPLAPMQRAYARLGDLNGEVTTLRTEYPHRDLSIVDVLNGGCSKGAAVERWARHRGVARAEIAAIGDNFNDIEMLECAGRAYVMGNADVAMKQRAGWNVVGTLDECGVAQAVGELLGDHT